MKKKLLVVLFLGFLGNGLLKADSIADQVETAVGKSDGLKEKEEASLRLLAGFLQSESFVKAFIDYLSSLPEADKAFVKEFCALLQKYQATVSDPKFVAEQEALAKKYGNDQTMTQEKLFGLLEKECPLLWGSRDLMVQLQPYLQSGSIVMQHLPEIMGQLLLQFAQTIK